MVAKKKSKSKDVEPEVVDVIDDPAESVEEIQEQADATVAYVRRLTAPTSAAANALKEVGVSPPAGPRLIRFKKTGGGSFRLHSADKTRNGKIIKPKQEFDALLEEIPKAFRDTIVSLETIPAGEAAPIAVRSAFEIRPCPSEEGKFNVVNASSGKAINDKPMDVDDAGKLLDKLQ